MFGPVPSELPPEIPEEKFRELLEALENKARKIGLYLNAVALNIDQGEVPDEDEGEETESGEPKRHGLMVQFTIGDHAFSKAVQDPEADDFDLEFKKIESGTVHDQIDEIRRQYGKKPEDERSPQVGDDQEGQGQGNGD